MRLSRLGLISLEAENFPSFSEGLSLRRKTATGGDWSLYKFPFLFGGTFIEAWRGRVLRRLLRHFPSFSEGLSLRRNECQHRGKSPAFPFLFGGTFIEAFSASAHIAAVFIISLPFRRDFH